MAKSQGPWKIKLLQEVEEWIAQLDEKTHQRVTGAIEYLIEEGPTLGRPTVDTVKGSKLANLKELRASTVRILFVFDPWRRSVLLVAGDKAGKWKQWYKDAIPVAEQRYANYLKQQAEEEGR